MVFGRLFKKGTIKAAYDDSLVLVNQDNISYIWIKLMKQYGTTALEIPLSKFAVELLPKLADRRINTKWLLLGR